MKFKNLDLDADKALQYTSGQEAIDALCPEGISSFGPIFIFR